MSLLIALTDCVISGKNAEAQLMVGDPDVNINVLDEVSVFNEAL